MFNKKNFKIIKNKDIEINTYIDGYVASAATLLTVVGTNRYINKRFL